MADEVKDGAVVSLAYTLRLSNGEIIDFSEAADPLEHVTGGGQVPGPLFEVAQGVPEPQVIVAGLGHQLRLAPEQLERVVDTAAIRVRPRKHDPAFRHQVGRRRRRGQLSPQLVDPLPTPLRAIAIHEDGMLFGGVGHLHERLELL